MELRDISLVKKLVRLFTGPLARYQVQHVQRTKKKFYQRYKSAAPWNKRRGDAFKATDYQLLKSLSLEQVDDRSRVVRYQDFDTMEYMPEIHSALNIYADEMTTSSGLSPLLKIRSKKPEIQEILHTLFYKILNIETNAFSWARNMVKYGDFFIYLSIDDEVGITTTYGLPTREMKRIGEGVDPNNPNYYKYVWTTNNLEFESFEIAHFRILGDERYTPYGESVLEGARRISRQLNLMIDAMMSYRIVRAPEKKAIYVDLTGIPADEHEIYMQQAITSLKRHQIINSETGEVNLRYNIAGIDEDYFIPISGKGSQTRIDPLPGGSFVGDIDDVKLLRDQLFAAILIPQAYLTGEGGAEGQTALSQKDIRFARTIQRLQRSFLDCLYHMAILHLTLLGFDDNDIIDFTLELNNPSKIAELQELEEWKTKLTAAAQASESKLLPLAWIYSKMLGINEEDIPKMKLELETDAKWVAKLTALSSGSDAEGGIAGDALGDSMDLGGLGGEDMGLGGEDMGEPMAGMPVPAGEGLETEPPKDSALLTKPGHRSTNPYYDPTPAPMFIQNGMGNVNKNKMGLAAVTQPGRNDARAMGSHDNLPNPLLGNGLHNMVVGKKSKEDKIRRLGLAEALDRIKDKING